MWVHEPKVRLRERGLGVGLGQQRLPAVDVDVLWDGVLAVTGTDGFFELKRTRDRKPSFV
jgi:hypothetical protein